MYASSQKFIYPVIIAALVGLVWLSGGHYQSIQKENIQIVSFIKLLNNVLRPGKEVSFDDRFKLEQAVRGFHDEKILSLWQDFVNAKSQYQAQNKLLDLLETLLDHVR